MKRVLRKGEVVRCGRLKLTFAVLLATFHGYAQSFTNLDFELANLSGYSAGSVPVADALPGWTASLGGTVLTNVNYNVPINQGLQIDIIGPGTVYGSRQGDYFIYLIGSGFDDEIAAISQTGTIPATAQSMTIRASIDVLGEIISFDGQSLSFKSLGSGVYGADVSAYAGQTGELLFTASRFPGAAGYFLDNIQFSEQPIPEPGTLGLVIVGAAFVGARRLRRFATVRSIPPRAP